MLSDEVGQVLHALNLPIRPLQPRKDIGGLELEGGERRGGVGVHDTPIDLSIAFFFQNRS